MRTSKERAVKRFASGRTSKLVVDLDGFSLELELRHADAVAFLLVDHDVNERRLFATLYPSDCIHLREALGAVIARLQEGRRADQ